jgi:uncharacterized protein (DUF1499 family)
VETPAPANRLSTFAVVGLLAAMVAALMVAGAGPAYRFGMLRLGRAFSMITWGAWLGLGAMVMALIAAWWVRRHPTWRSLALALGGVLLGGLAFAIPFAMLLAAKRAPSIHDITTDTANPPRFVAVVPLRNGAPNPVEYGGESIAAQQRTAYPDIQPLMLPVPPDRAYQRALDTARHMGWAIDASAPAEGRIEATDTTTWFGFKDDIVVRVAAAAEGSRIDVRSVSRLGTGDLGKNARRVRSYLRALSSQ